MKKTIVLSIIVCLSLLGYSQIDKVVFIPKNNVNPVQLQELQKNGAILDEFTTYTDKSLMEKIASLQKNWTRDDMKDLVKSFKMSPDQFGMLLDTLNSVVIKQANEIPGTKVGKIAIAGFAWKIAGPDIIQFVLKILFLIFFIWFFLWSYKKNLWTTRLVIKKQRKLFLWIIPYYAPLETKKVAYTDLFSETKNTDNTTSEVDITMVVHIAGAVIFLVLTMLSL